MRRVLIYLVFGITFISIGLFLAGELSPFDTSKIEELIISENIVSGDLETLNSKLSEIEERGLLLNFFSENAYIVGGIILLGIFMLFAGIHLVIDKIFFKNFYEKPSHFDALRRAFLLIISITSLAYSKITNADEILFVLSILTPIMFEIVFKLYFKKDNQIEVKEKEVVRSKNVGDGNHISYEETINDIERFSRVNNFKDRNTRDL